MSKHHTPYETQDSTPLMQYGAIGKAATTSMGTVLKEEAQKAGAATRASFYAAEGDQHGQSFAQTVKKQFASGNWTYILHFTSFVSGAALIVCGVLSVIPGFSTITETLNPLHYIACAYLILFGLLMICVLIEFPPCWQRLTQKWVPFLLTFRGRGFFLIFLGSLAGAMGLIGWVIGGFCAVVGFFNIFLACFYKNKLRKKYYEQVA